MNYTKLGTNCMNHFLMLLKLEGTCPHSLKLHGKVHKFINFILCSYEERKSYRFGTAWVNDDRIVILSESYENMWLPTFLQKPEMRNVSDQAIKAPGSMPFFFFLARGEPQHPRQNHGACVSILPMSHRRVLPFLLCSCQILPSAGEARFFRTGWCRRFSCLRGNRVQVRKLLVDYLLGGRKYYAIKNGLNLAFGEATQITGPLYAEGTEQTGDSLSLLFL